jgi:lipopolysaccharide transport system ATP-binding protein
MKTILEVNNVSKKYSLSGINPAYQTLSGSMANFFSRGKNEEREFWALNDISFEVKEGDTLGIIGRNGAGKTTLLKIISRITSPTSGRITGKGKVTSLLEVGTGFHLELTGRENIYMNGSILGLKKKEIDAKLEEIVEFSGVGEFIDNPLKFYSSGMQLRLAFSIGAHLEPEILAIDEVLAVGDSLFQQKCIEKMTSIAKSGRTILFVSHNMQALKTICNKAIVVDAGKKVFDGIAEAAVEFYNTEQRLQGQTINLLDLPRGKYVGELIFRELRFASPSFQYGEDISFSVLLKTVNPASRKDNLIFGANVVDRFGNNIYHISNILTNQPFTHNSDTDEYQFSIKSNLRTGQYRLTICLTINDVIQDFFTELINFTIEEGNPYGFSKTGFIQGMVFTRFEVKQKSSERL